MKTLLEIRSELRSLIAADERDELDQIKRCDVLRRVIAALQDYEIAESDMIEAAIKVREYNP